MKPLLCFLIALIPLLTQAGDEENPPAVEVQTAKVIRTTLSRTITAYGNIEPDPGGENHAAALAQLSPLVPGVITEINVILGQRVKKGDILFRLDSRAAKAAVKRAAAKVTAATEDAARQQKLVAAQATSEKKILAAKQILAESVAELEQMQFNLSLLDVKAPISGTVSRFTARVGEATTVSAVLAEIIALDRLVAIIRVPAALIPEIKKGQKATIIAAGQKTATSTSISYIDPRANPLSNTVAVRLTVPAASRLKAGQFISSMIVVEEKADCLAVPHAAVFTDTEGNSKLSLVVDGKSKQIPVTPGLRGEKLVEVSGEGIREGETVITIGSYALPPGTQVRSSAR